jgi:hypothetical protein
MSCIESRDIIPADRALGHGLVWRGIAGAP